MLKKILPAVFTAALLVILSPSSAHAYGAAYRGRTYVGGYGAYHSSSYAYRGSGGSWAVGGRQSAYGYGGSTSRYGGVYHSGSVGYGQYPNTTTYHSGSYSRSYGYGYFR
jgi:hypothetical protein